MPVRVEKWDKAWGALNEANMGKRLENEGYAVGRYTYPPGTYFPDHTHEIDKKDGVLTGRLKIIALGKEFVLEPGDIIEIPTGTVHSAEVVGREAVLSLDATRPARSG